MVPFQHYLGKLGDQNFPKISRNRNNPEPYSTPVINSRNGVLISADGGKTWSEHGDIRLPIPDNTHLWAEPAIVEPTKGRIVMLVRPEWGAGGKGSGKDSGGAELSLYRAESNDGGLTWPDVAEKTDIPNPSSKVALFLLAENTVAMLHNPNPVHRSPLALWISFDGMKTWPYRRKIVAESTDGPNGSLNYPEGYVSADKKWLYFAFDNNRHQAVFVKAKLPPLDGIPQPVYESKDATPLIPPRVAVASTSKLSGYPFRQHEDGKPFQTSPASKLEIKGEAEHGTFKEKTRVFTDRNYELAQCPEVLDGRSFVRSSINGVEVVCRDSGMLYVLTPTSDRNSKDSQVAALESMGFEKVAQPETLIFEHIPAAIATLYQKEVKAGETIKLSKWAVIVY